MAKVNANAVLFGDGSSEDEVVDFEAVVDAAGDVPPATEGEAADASDLPAEPVDGGDTADADAAGEPPADAGSDEGDDGAGSAGDDPGDGSGDTDDADPPVDPPVDEAAELREQLNRALWENQQYAAQQQALLQHQQQHSPPPPPAAPAPAGDDPLSIFRHSLETGDDAGAQQVIARVSMDAAQFAAQAAQFRAEGEDDAAALYENRALNATTFAEQMRHDRATAAYQRQIDEQVTPLQEQAYAAELNAAATRVFSDPVIESAYQPEHTEQIANYIRQYPQIMDHGPEEGFRAAAEAVVFGGREGMINHMVQMRLDAVAAQPPTRPPAARGGGGGAGARTPAPTRTATESEDDAIRESIQTNIPNGMNVLFGGG